jgi:antitoxin component of MazEF toxin-antitoxin module
VDERCRVVLPPEFAGETVTITTTGDGDLTVTLVRDYRKRPSLAKLAAGITDENRHEDQSR